MRLAFLTPVSVIAFQAALAWTRRDAGNGMFTWSVDARHYAPLALSPILAAVSRLWVDPHLEAAAPGLLAASWQDLLVSLPWVVLFQPLLFVAAVYAFVTRLVHMPLVAMAAVVVVHQAVVMQQMHVVIGDAALLAALMIVAGAYALLMALAYRTHGYVGVMLIALIRHARFLFG